MITIHLDKLLILVEVFLLIYYHRTIINKIINIYYSNKFLKKIIKNQNKIIVVLIFLSRHTVKINLHRLKSNKRSNQFKKKIEGVERIDVRVSSKIPS